jgi:predicted transposase YbfD/YdcC
MNLLQQSALSFFSLLPDPRRKKRCKHKLSEIIAIAVCARLTGAEHFTEIEDFAREREQWLREFLVLEGGLPSHDTFRRVFCLIDQKYFERLFQRWAKTLTESLDELSIDGKTVNGTFGEMNKGPRPVTLVSVYARESGLVLAQSESSSTGNAEMSAALECIAGLNLEKCLVTVDAGIGRKTLLSNVIEKRGDYVTAIKSNARSHYRELKSHVGASLKIATKTESRDKNHGRRERRTAHVMSATGLSESFLTSYPEAKTVIVVDRIRQSKDKRYVIQKTGTDGKQYYEKNKSKTKTSKVRVYYVSSKKLSADQALDKIRAHWGIENKLHWSLDVTFNEDACQLRERTCAANFALLRKIVFNIIQRCPDKGSKKLKMRRATLNSDYLKKLLLNEPI